MLYRVQLRLLHGSEADATTVRDKIQQKLSTTVPYRTHVALASYFNAVEAIWVTEVDVSFLLSITASDVRDDAVAKWSSGSLKARILAGSTASVHECPHAGGEPGSHPSCRTQRFDLKTK